MLLRSSEQHAAVAMRCTVVSRQHAAANDAHQEDNGLQSVSPSSHAMLDQGALHTEKLKDAPHGQSMHPVRESTSLHTSSPCMEGATCHAAHQLPSKPADTSHLILVVPCI